MVHDLRRNYSFNILAVAEPRVIGAVADRIVENLAFESSYRVEAQGLGACGCFGINYI